MADEALGREIKQFREDTSRSFQRLETGLDKLLPREVYSANHEALKRRVDTLERDLERAEIERKQAAERTEADRTAMRRWLISAVVLPVVFMIITIAMKVA